MERTYVFVSLLYFTFALGLDYELFAFLFQFIGGNTGVGPWEQCGGGKSGLILYPLQHRMG